MTDPLRDREIALGVTGSIAAYKALDLASRLTQAGARVDVILTRSARQLVQPLAFQALTHRPVVVDLFDPVGLAALDHVTIARRIDLLLVAPVTADTLARLALGRADDPLATTALATTAPLVVAPAMEPNMWSHEQTRAHVETLRGRGVVFVGPEPGRMASGVTGLGRMAEPAVVLDVVRWRLSRDGPMAGRRVLVTAGPTREPLDPVRYLSNHSSGKMGLAVAVAARDRGAQVDLVHGPIALEPIAGVAPHPVETAQEMCARVLELSAAADALVMAAAVADYRSEHPSERKLKKTTDDLTLRLVRTPDVLQTLDQALAGRDRRLVRVGFAAETEDLVENARAKLVAKALDLVVANPVPDTFGADAAAVTLVDRSEAVPLAARSKRDVAEAILDRVARLWAAGAHPGLDPDEARGAR